MNNKNKFVPKLRFPEFWKDGNWTKKKLGEIGKFTGGGTPSRDNEAYWQGKIPWISSSDIEEDSIYTVNTSRFISDEALSVSATKLVPSNSILLVSRVGVGKLAITHKPICTSQDFTNFTPNNSNLVFLAYCLNNHKETLLSFSQGMAIKGFTKDDISNLNIPLPSIDEQQKIADCLSSLDEVITAESKKLDVLKEHKKGLLQNLLPHEGETVPKFRFKEFDDSGEWEVVKLENYIDLFSGIALKSEEISSDASGIPILRGINITEGFIRHSKDIDKYFLGDLENLKKYLVKENDIVIGMDGSKVGKNVALIKKEDANSILIQRVARIITNDKADINYVYHHFLSDNFRGYVDTVNTSSGIPHISAQQIKDFQIAFPPKLKEQEKIAETLTSIDDLINAQSKKIESLKLHKKGLLQGLFPDVNRSDSMGSESDQN